MKLPLIFALWATSIASIAQPLPKIGELPFERLYQWPAIAGRSPAGPSMSPDGRHIVFAWNQTGARVRDLWILSYPSGEKRELVKATDIPRPLNQDDARTKEQKDLEEKYDGGFGGGARWSPDSREFLVGYRGRTWRISPDGRTREPLFDGNFEASAFEYTQDGRYLLFLHESNLWRMDRLTRQLRQLTFVTRGSTAVSAFDVSPDGRRIAIGWSNFANFGNHVMMDFTQDRSQVRPITRMWNGNVEAMDARYGVIGIDGGLIQYVESIPRVHWGLGSRGTGLEWAPDSSGFLVGWKSEDHKNWYLSYIRAGDAREFRIYSETAPKNYINNWRPFEWTRDSEHILLGTDVRDGKFTRRQIVKMTRAGREITPYFSRDFDVANFQRPPASDDLVIVTQGRNPLLGEVRILSASGAERTFAPVELGWNTPTEFEGAGDVLVSDNGQHVATLAHTYNMNPEIFGLTPRTERLTRSQTADFAKIPWSTPQLISFPGPEGVTLHGHLLLPPGFQRGQPRPMVIADMYANSGKVGWNGYNANYMAQSLGYVVLLLDFRASWGYGGEFNSGYYQRMGLIDSEEAVAAKKYLVEQGYADPDRCGVTGWSYGGFLTCMILMTQPGQFKVGVAGASVTEWRNYNHWYTRQRLGRAKEDKAIFDKTSPITYVDKLQDNLLLIHGMLDDNVLFQDSVRLSMMLIDKGKQFDMFYYPRDNHGMVRDETRLHSQQTIMRYFIRHLGLGR